MAKQLVGYTLPQTLVHQQISQQVRNTIADLQAVVVGPQFDLKRYSVASEKAQIGVGRYNTGQAATYRWPARPVGGVADLNWVKVFVDNAYMRYWTSTNALNLVPGTHNHIKDPGTVWADYKSWDRSPTLPARGVKVGDGIRVRVPAANVDILTQIISFEHDAVAASVGAPVAAPSNQAAQPAFGAVVNSFGSGTLASASVDVSAYDGASANLFSDTYTVYVKDASSSPVLFTVASTHGDNEDNVALDGFDTIPLGAGGATLTFDMSGGAAFVDHQTWEVEVVSAFTPPVATAGGTYVGPSDTTYLVTVTQSGVAGGPVPPHIEVTAHNGIDRSLPAVVGAGGTPIGSYGATISFSGPVAEGDQFTVSVTAAQLGPLHTIALAHSLPNSVTPSMPIQIDLMLRKDIVIDQNRRGEPPLKNYTVDEVGVSLGSVVTHFDAEITDDAGTPTRLELHQGEIYIQYRCLMQQNAYGVQEFFPESISSLAEAVGEVTADNPLALGLSLALQNSAAGDSVGVLYIAVSSNDVDGYAKALDRLTDRIGAYGLVPLTQDPAVHKLFAAHVNAMSTAENGRWRVCWLNSESGDISPIVVGTDDEPILAALESAPEDGGQALTVRWADGKFLSSGVRTGDILRINYRSDGFDDTWTWDEFEVDRVISEDAIKIHRDAGYTTPIAIKVEIWRNLTSNEMAEFYGMKSAQFATRRVRHIWPPKATINGEEAEGFYLCAGLAGRRASVAPQQGLTNVPLYGIDAVPMTTDLMSVADLNLMASLGTWIVTRNLATGVIYSRHQLTTADYGNTNECEDSLVTNMDSVSYQYLRAFESYTGQVNITTASIAQLKAEWLLVTQQMQVAHDVMLGPQLVEAELTSFAQHPLLPDRVLATVKCSGPQPFNNFDLFLVA